MKVLVLLIGIAVVAAFSGEEQSSYFFGCVEDELPYADHEEQPLPFICHNECSFGDDILNSLWTEITVRVLVTLILNGARGGLYFLQDLDKVKCNKE